MKLALFDIENWKEIGATLARNKTRTFLTGFGIFWGVAMLTMLLGGARGAEDMIRRNFAGFATNSGAIISNNTSMPYKGYQKGRYWNMDYSDVTLIRELFPDMQAVIPTYQKWGSSIKNNNGSFTGQVIGAEANYIEMSQPILNAGRYLNEADIQQERKVVVVGKKLANKLFPDQDPLGQAIDLNGGAYNVVGVVSDASEIKINGGLDENVMIPASTFRRAYGRGNEVDFIMLVAKDNAKLGDMLPDIKRIMARRHDIHPNDEGAFYVINVAENFEQVDMVFTGIQLLALFIGLSTLMAGIIGIGNIMWVIVKERTQEIGIRRAIGAKPIDIITQVLCEGLALTTIAGLAGMVFAVGVLAIVHHLTNSPDQIMEAHFQMNFSKAVAIMLLFLVLGVLAGIAPSIKAMRIKPIEAINSK